MAVVRHGVAALRATALQRYRAIRRERWTQNVMFSYFADRWIHMVLSIGGAASNEWLTISSQIERRPS
jgi:hypothetical protein